MTKIFGQIDGVTVGSNYRTREELRVAGIHSPIQAGISGNADEGADSIVLSGGYPDDQFNGDSILYTGSGKRDPFTDRLTEDQKMSGGNKALARSCDDGLPIRVVRALGAQRKQLPKHGYLYEGIYYIESYSQIIGVDGFKIWQFSLVRQSEAESFLYSNIPQRRISTTVQRIVRNTLIANTIKKMYEYECQICGIKIKTPSGHYSEGAHIRPLGMNHNGADQVSNILCLCPNHHVMLDYGSIYINEDFYVVMRGDNSKLGKLNVHPSHKINVENLTYQKAIFDK